MESLATLLSYEFVRNAIYAGLLASVLCGVIGTFVVVKRLVFVSGGISHAAFGGLGVCYFMGIQPLAGAAATAVLAALWLGSVGHGRERSRDASIGVLWAVGMAVGAIFIFKTPGYAPNLMTYLFGNILTVERGDVLLTLIGLLVIFFEEFVAVAFDEEFAKVQGVPVRGFTTLLMVLVALSVVLLIQLVGIILVIALLTIPPVIGLMLTRSFHQVMILSTLIGAVMTLGGLALSYGFDLPSGPTIVLLGTVLMLAVALLRRMRREKRVRSPQQMRDIT
ncbi:MAG: metal ABC transporter permease [Acidobacteria bacterium]|nr:MAG: metal ABC transporter permease [Acidobacteriota bacterium]